MYFLIHVTVLHKDSKSSIFLALRYYTSQRYWLVALNLIISIKFNVMLVAVEKSTMK